jgi:hypothetical protein
MLFAFLGDYNNAVMNMRMQTMHADFSSFGHIPYSRIDGSHGTSIFTFLEKSPYCFP